MHKAINPKMVVEILVNTVARWLSHDATLNVCLKLFWMLRNLNALYKTCSDSYYLNYFLEGAADLWCWSSTVIHLPRKASLFLTSLLISFIHTLIYVTSLIGWCFLVVSFNRLHLSNKSLSVFPLYDSLVLILWVLL